MRRLCGWTLVLLVSVLSPIDRLDHEVRSAVQSGRRPGFEGVMSASSHGLEGWRLAVAVGAIALIDRAAGPATLGLALVAAVPTNLIVEGLKWGVQRPRPNGRPAPGNSSFPSSHAANAFALAVILSRRWRRIWPVFLAAALLVAFSRMYLDRHYLSDVVVGAAIGTACAALTVFWLGDRLLPRAVRGRKGAPTLEPPGAL
jgi:membrane-associated phospholipid phosphatase